MKRKLFFLLALMLGFVSGIQARTDVTSTYLTDAALEDETTNWALASKDGNHNWNADYKYHESWHNTFSLSQTATVPNGYYQISIQVMNQQCPSSNFTLTATSGGNSATAYARHGSGGKDFAALSASFASDPLACRIYATVKVENGSLTVGASQTSNAEWIVYGQFKLYSLTKAEYDNAMALQSVIEENNNAWTDGWTNQGNLFGFGRERFNETAYAAGKIIYKTFSGLPRGKYNVKVHAKANKAWRDVATGDNIAEVYANDANSKITVEDKTGYEQTAEYNYDFNNVLVNNGNLEVGIRNTATGGNWYVASLLHLTLVDPYISVIADGEFTSGNTMDAETWYSYNVPTDGDYTLSATDGIVYSIGDKLVSEASAVTSPLALPAGTIYIKSSTSQALTISYVEPALENGTYYLYDADSKTFLSRGASYGTQATLDNYGIPIIWNNYTKTIGFVDWTGVGLFINGSGDFFTDGGTPANFVFEETEGGLYLRDAAKTKYVGLKDGSYFDNKVFTFTTESSQAVVFTAKMKSEHDAIVAAYPTSNKTAVIAAASLPTDAAGLEDWLAANRAAKDYTSHVGTAKFVDSAGDWTWHGTNRTRNGQPAYGTNFAEMFSVTGYIDQTISDLPEGLYKVTVNAFEREKGYADCNTLGAAGWEIVTAYFDANGQAVQLCSWYSQKEGTNNPNTTGEAASAFNSDKYKNEIYCYVGNDGELTLKLAKPSYIWDSWVLFNNVTLTYYDTNVSDEDATAILAEADEQMAKPMLATLCSAISDAKETFNGSRTVPNYNALRTAIDASATSVDSYAAMKTNYLDPLKAVLDANNFYSSSARSTVYDTYKTQYDEGTIANATATSLNWKSGTRYEAPVNNMMMDIWKIGNTAALTNNSGLYINTWSGESAGEAPAKDFENPFYEYWVSSGSLPATTLTGKLAGLTANTIYKITANVRVQGSSKVAKSITMQVGDGAETDVTAGSQIGETERYIGSYSAIGITDGDGNLTLAFNVAGSSNISWLAFRDVNYEAVTTVADAKNYLNARISAASALLEEYEGNVGSGVFQIPTSAETTFSGAITTATTESESGSSTLSSVTTAATTLNTAINAYDNVTLNAPAAETRYTLALAGRGTLTFAANAGTDGGFDLNFDGASENKAQSFILTQVSGNDYTFSFVDAEGTAHYICTGEKAKKGLGNDRIRTTTTSSDALTINISATTTANVFNMLNTEYSNNKIGSNGGGMYTANDYTSWSIAEASKTTAKMVISAVAKKGTFCAPFAVTIPANVKAYTVTKDEDKDYVTLEEVSTPISAGIPVLVEFTGSGDDPINVTFTEFATVNSPKESNVFIGVFEKTEVPDNDDNYILQYQDGTCAFYPVKESGIYAGANRCYLHAEAAETARIAIGGEEDPTAINAIEAAAEEGEDLKDGKYLIDGQIIIVKNGVKYSANGQILK